MMRSPDGAAARDAQLRDDIKQYRRTLQKISKVKTKILIALRDEGCPEAGHMLQTPPSQSRAPRCRECGGCRILERVGPCLSCLDCRAEEDCTEHTRLCFGWRQPATTFVMGSTVTGVSSICNAADYELDKYKELIEKLGEASLEVDATLDQFPAGSTVHANDRFNQGRRERDLLCEDEQLVLIETLLNRYQEERVRLRDIHSDDEDGDVDDAVEVQGGPPGGYGLMSQTETHYTFGNHRVPEGFTLGLVPDGDHGLGLGAGDASILDTSLLTGLDAGERMTSPVVPQPGGPPPRAAAEEAVSPPRGARPKVTLSNDVHEERVLEEPTLEIPAERGARPIVTLSNDGREDRTIEDPARKVPTGSNSAGASGMPTGGPGGPGSDETRRQNGTPLSSAGATTLSMNTSTTTSASVRMSSHEASSVLTPPTAASGFRMHRRASSEGEIPGRKSTDMKDRLFEVKMLVAGRSKTWAQDMGTLAQRLKASTGGSIRWAEEEVRSLKTRLDELEQLESSAWKWIAESEGTEARRVRISRWLSWHEKQIEHVRSAKKLMWDSEQRRDDDSHRSRDSGTRSRGHVEKVKLPTFSGRQEDFAEFKNQFRELCKGEQYTPVLEMAQLKQKLPREALAAIGGIQCPEVAWKRLEEVYGNREISIMSAIKNLRDFHSSKAAPHEQMIELAMAVQKCTTELRNIGAVDDLLGDRESLACILLAMPQTIKDKWYDKDVPDDTKKKGEVLLEWIEIQRKNAIKVRLDTMAAKMRGPAQSTSAGPKTTASLDSTDRGLTSSSMHTQGGSKETPSASYKPAVTPAVEKTGAGGDKPASGARIEVKTVQDAKMVADKRKQSLTERKLDKCPVCGEVHTYERTWPATSPPVKARLISTHLTTCGKFLAMSPDAKMAAVVGNAGCLVCAAWDHTVHKYPGGKPGRELKCSQTVNGVVCGSAHGRWYHETATSGASHSVVASVSSQGPGLYEVYLSPIHPPSSQANQVAASGMIMIDPGSDTNFVRHDFAEAIGLTGEECQFRLKVVDRDARPLTTKRYVLEIEDKEGKRHAVTALGLESITVLPPDPDFGPIRDLLQHVPPTVLDRPQGNVDILLGLKNSALHGRTVEQWGNLRLLESPLGCGWSLRGSHQDLVYPQPRLGPSLSAAGYALGQAVASTEEELGVFHLQELTEFHELNELGTSPPPVCLKCRGCRDCTFRRKRLSPEDQEVVMRVEREMQVDSVSGKITAVYPWKNCVKRMTDNRRQAQKVQESMERHMIAAGTHQDYIKEMEKSLAEGKVRRLSQQEMADWHGPQHYITTFAVIKPESLSTKTRVVSNSAMRNARARLSLNQCMWPGPNALSDLLDCLIFWRAVQVAMNNQPEEGIPVNIYWGDGAPPAQVSVPTQPGRAVGGLSIYTRHVWGRGGWPCTGGGQTPGC